MDRRTFTRLLSVTPVMGALARLASARSTRRPFLLTATVDFPDDVTFGPYNEHLLDEMMKLMKSMGVRRVNWLYYGDVDPSSEWAGTMFDYVPYGRKTVQTIGEPLQAAVRVAHQYGLEIYGVLKPFDSGESATYPEGAPHANATSIKRIGGTLQMVLPFIERHPELRIQRRPWLAPARLDSLPIRKIRLLKGDDSPTRLRRENLEIWTSQNNYCYRRRDVAFTLKEAVEAAPREVRDYYGQLVTRQGAPVRTLTLEGLDLADRYILVTSNFDAAKGDFRNTALGMVEAYGPGPEPLPIVVATRSAIWDNPRDFRTGGLEFDSGCGPFQVELDTANTLIEKDAEGCRQGGCIAFARGKNDYLPSAPCEAYPAVQKYWLGRVDRLLQTGVDGVDVRISAHGSLTDEPWEYGFNEPIVAEYRQRYGADISRADEDQRRLAALRGEKYTAFLREASRRVRASGRKMQVHIHTEAFRANPCCGQLMGFPANLDFDWKRWLKESLVDSVTLRTSWFEAMEDTDFSQPQRYRLSEALGDPVVKEALALANELRLPVYLNRYLKRATSTKSFVSDLEATFHDMRFSGFDIYEFIDVGRPSPDGSRLNLVGDAADQIRAGAKDLEIL